MNAAVGLTNPPGVEPQGSAAGGAQGMFRMDSAGLFAYVDARAAEIVGYAPDELPGRHFTTLLLEEDRPRGQGNFAQRQQGIGGVSEYRVRRKDGTATRVTVASVPTFDGGGVFLGTAGFVTDIERQRRQEELSAQERRLLRQIAGNYPLAAVLEDLCLTLETFSGRPLRATVMLVEGDRLRCVAAPSLPPAFRTDSNATRLENSGTACAEAVRSGRVVVVGAVWSYPIVQDGQTLGTLALLADEPGEPDADAERLIEFAVQVARLALAHERRTRALRESEQRFRDYADLSADCFWEQDAEYRFTEMSGGVFSKGGFRIADSLGKARWELPIEGIDEAQWAEHRALLERHEVFHDFAYEARAADGSLRWHSVSGKPVFAADGGFLGYRGIGRDITAQVAAREMLEKTRRWLEQAVRAANIGLWERDTDTGAFRFSDNWKALFGYTEDEIGHSFEDFDRLVHPDDLARIKAFAQAYVENPQGDYENRFRIRHRNGSWRWVLTRGNVLTDAATGRRTWMGCHIDITEHMRAEEQLRELTATLEARVEARAAALQEANRELDAFTFSVTHDLRTPLRAIEGFSRALLEDCRECLDEAGRDCLRRIGAATTRMGERIEALHELSRLSRAPLRLRPVDLSALAREVADEMRARDPQRAADIDIAETPPVEGDPRLLRIALANLLGNAWKYTANTAPARIAFGAECDGDGRSVYFVRDNGAGFDMQFADKLFRMFHRLHRDEDFPGQGVGLPTVQCIVARHGGRVWGEGEKGRGATFFFTFWADNARLAEAREATGLG